MKKIIICLLVLSFMFVLAPAVTAVEFSPEPPTSPTFTGPVPSFSLPALRTLPGLFPGIPSGFVPVPVKLGLSDAETAALTGMARGAVVPVYFVLPFFMIGQELLWNSSDTSVASVTQVPPAGANITAVGSGTALITVATADGSFSFSFYVTVN